MEVASQGAPVKLAGKAMSKEFTCEVCNQPVTDFWNSPPTCNRCLVVKVIRDALWGELERQSETERFGPCVDRDTGLVDGRVDMQAVADAVLLRVFDEADDVTEQGHLETLREYLTQTGWR